MWSSRISNYLFLHIYILKGVIRWDSTWEKETWLPKYQDNCRTKEQSGQRLMFYGGRTNNQNKRSIMVKTLCPFGGQRETSECKYVGGFNWKLADILDRHRENQGYNWKKKKTNTMQRPKWKSVHFSFCVLQHCLLKKVHFNASEIQECSLHCSYRYTVWQ